MTIDDQPVLAHHWKVTFTHPTPCQNKAFPGAEYNRTMLVGVVADSFDGCIARVRELFPRATIYTASHQGKIQVDARPPDLEQALGFLRLLWSDRGLAEDEWGQLAALLARHPSP